MKRNVIILLSFLLIIPLVSYHCGQEQSPEEEAVNWQEERGDLIDTMQARLNQIEEKIGEMNMDESGQELLEDMTEESRERLEMLEDLQEELKNRIRELEEATEETWRDVKKDIVQNWEDLKSRIDREFSGPREEEKSGEGTQ